MQGWQAEASCKSCTVEDVELAAREARNSHVSSVYPAATLFVLASNASVIAMQPKVHIVFKALLTVLTIVLKTQIWN